MYFGCIYEAKFGLNLALVSFFSLVAFWTVFTEISRVATTETCYRGLDALITYVGFIGIGSASILSRWRGCVFVPSLSRWRGRVFVPFLSDILTLIYGVSEIFKYLQRGRVSCFRGDTDRAFWGASALASPTSLARSSNSENDATFSRDISFRILYDYNPYTMSICILSDNGVSYGSFESSARALHTNMSVGVSSSCSRENSSLYMRYAGFFGPYVCLSNTIAMSHVFTVLLTPCHHVAARPVRRIDNPFNAFSSDIFVQSLYVTIASKNASTSDFLSPSKRDVHREKLPCGCAMFAAGTLAADICICCLSVANCSST